MSAKKDTKKTPAIKKKAVKKNKSKKPVVVQKEMKAIHKSFDGIVVSVAMDKTIVARVDKVRVHSKYMKRFTVSRKYKIHDEMNKYKVGDKVSFVECRPMSKDKRWRVI